jgi:hypothetical protein
MKKSHTAVKRCAQMFVAAVLLLGGNQDASAREVRCKDYVRLDHFNAELAASKYPDEFTQPLYLVGMKDASGRQTNYGFSTRPPGSARDAITFTAYGKRNDMPFFSGDTFNGRPVFSVNVGLVSNLVVDEGPTYYVKWPHYAYTAYTRNGR